LFTYKLFHALFTGQLKGALQDFQQHLAGFATHPHQCFPQAFGLLVMVACREEQHGLTGEVCTTAAALIYLFI
jgi:hypothetical protein